MIDLAPGKIVAGKFRLERLLAQGGMGSVWAARHLGLDIIVAVKFMGLALSADTTAHARFAREAKAAAQVRSPHVVQVMEYGVDEDTPYIVMELLEGEDLGARLRREKRVSLAAAVDLASQIAKALRRAHEAGIVHRDLKPANIFLARHDDDEIVKVLDFGIAKLVGPGPIVEGTSSELLLGSPRYMSPEQVRQRANIDHRSDLWSLGVILYRAITGKSAFGGGEAGDVLVRICTEAPRPPSHVASDLPVQLDAFFQRALAIDPSERFQTAREMAAEFAAVVRSVSPGLAVALRDSTTSQHLDVGLLARQPVIARPLHRATSPAPAEGTLTLRVAVSHRIPPSAPRPTRVVSMVAVAMGAAIVAVAAGTMAWRSRGSDAEVVSRSAPIASPGPEATAEGRDVANAPASAAAPAEAPEAMASVDAGAGDAGTEKAAPAHSSTTTSPRLPRKGGALPPAKQRWVYE